MWPPAVTGRASAGTGLSWPPTPPGGAGVRSLCRDVWSKMIEMTHVVLVQKESCDAALAYPPTARTPMLRVVLSDARRIWYRFPLYAWNSARVVLCAATQGVPALA